MSFNFKHILNGSLLAIWCAALSGLALATAPETFIALHLASSLAGLLFVTAFLARHWWSRRQAVTGRPAARLGYLSLSCMLVLSVSGLLMLRWTNYSPLRLVHTGTSLALVLVLTIHLAARLGKALGSNFRWAQLGSLRRWLLLGGISAGILIPAVWVSAGSRRPVQAQSASLALAHASLGDKHLPEAQECAVCHAQITQQWQASAHAHAADDAYYQAVTALFIEERGIEAVQYCAVCHAPIGLMQGELTSESARQAAAQNKGQASAYQARALGITLPLSAAGAEGVSCSLCHLAKEAAESPTNGSIQLLSAPPALPKNPLTRLALQAAPKAHKKTYDPQALQQAQLCGACHNLRLPDGLPLEPTYDEWLDSPYPAKDVTCQDCHFPQGGGARVNSDLPQPVYLHGGEPGAPSSLPGLSDGLALLRKAASLEAGLSFALGSGQELLAQVQVTNSGAGHHLPSGANDLRQMWLALTLTDGSGQVVWRSGVFDPAGNLDPTTVQFRKILGDANGQPIELHRIWVATQVLSDTSLAPLETRTVEYRIPLPPGAQPPYRLEARLLYRDVSQAFAEFALNRPAPDLPAFEMAASQAILR